MSLRPLARIGGVPIDFLFEILLELLWQLAGEALFTFVWESIQASFRDRPQANRALACIGYLLMGAILGAASGFAFPHRLSNRDGMSALGVVLNAVIAGMLAHRYGRARSRKGRTTTNLATFWGGAWFAFGLAAVRLWVIVGFWHR